MAKMLVKILMFCFPICIIAYIVDMPLTLAIRQSQGGDTQVWNDIIENKIKSDILIYGSSRALNHIDPFILKDSTGMSAYNLGLSGQNFTMMKCRHDLIMSTRQVPKYIIFSLDPFTLDKRDDLYNCESFAPFLNEKIIRDATKKFKGFDFFDYNFPLIRYVGMGTEIILGIKQMLHLKYKKNTIFPRGFSPHYEMWNREFEKVREDRKQIDFADDSETVVAFEQFLDNSKKNGIKIIFVFSPVYKDGQSFIENFESKKKYFAELAKKYDLPFLDYTSDTLCSDKNYFFNSMHLNYVGANIFSKHLAHDVKPLMGLH